MSLSPTQDLLDRIDRLHSILTNELPSLSSTIPYHTTSIDYVESSLTNYIPNNMFHSNIKSESMIINELQQYIQKLEREREILLRSYSIILQLLKHNNNTDNKIDLIDYDYSEL